MNYWGPMAIVLGAVIGLAVVSVLVSKNSNTTSVISAGTTGFAQILGAATGNIGGSGTGGLLSNSSGIWT